MATDPLIGTTIRRARERRQWTQQQLADAIGVSPRTIRNWEQGRVRGIRNRTGALEQVLGITLDGDSGNGAAPPREATPGELSATLRRLAEVLDPRNGNGGTRAG
jgi:transcriptional regulator with XRE-family HTH domain